MVDFLLGCTIVLCLAVMALAAASWFAGREYDRWKSEIDAKGIETALEPVLMGGEVVGYTLVTERRSNRC